MFPAPSQTVHRDYNGVLRNLKLLSQVSRDRGTGPLVSQALNSRLNEVIDHVERQSNDTMSRGQMVNFLSGSIKDGNNNEISIMSTYCLGKTSTFENSTNFYRKKFKISPSHVNLDTLITRVRTSAEILRLPYEHYGQVGNISSFLITSGHWITEPQYDVYDHHASNMLRST